MDIPIEYTDQAYWDGLDVTIFFDINLSVEDITSLNEVFNSWYNIEANDETHGNIHYITDLWAEDNQAGFSADMGSKNENSINTLILLLKKYSKCRNIVIKKIVFGSEIIE